MNPYPDWPWWRVKAALEERGTTLAATARSIGLTKAAANRTKVVPGPRMQAAIAAAIGLSPMAIWPSRYTAEGRPVFRTGWLKAHGRDKTGRKLPAGETAAAAEAAETPETKDEAA